MVQICALASGSNGNCYYVGNSSEAVLVDIGISNRQLKQRMKDAGLNLQNVKAVLVTHEHTDHIKGLHGVIKKNNIPGYVTRHTYNQARKDFRPEMVRYFEPGDTITLGTIKVHTFSKQHDAAQPVSFRVEIEGKNIAVLTDLGTVCPTVLDHIKQCDAAFLECNYEHDMLMNGSYPTFLKQRVASDFGHLSNSQAYELVKSLNGSPLKTVLLSHISADNNRVDLAMETFSPLAHKLRIDPTSRHSASKVIEI